MGDHRSNRRLGPLAHVDPASACRRVPRAKSYTSSRTHRAAIRRAVGIDFDFEILSVRNWTRRELIADRFGIRRAFIAGDAAHEMSPTGGYGGNTGIGDAVDLSWKLDATLSGWGGPSLLDAYTTERRPVAERNAKESSVNFSRMLSPGKMPLLCEDSPAGVHFREEFGRRFSDTMRPVWNTLPIYLDYRYGDSPICWDDGTPWPPRRALPTSKPRTPGHVPRTCGCATAVQRSTFSAVASRCSSSIRQPTRDRWYKLQRARCSTDARRLRRARSSYSLRTQPCPGAPGRARRMAR